MKQQTTKQCSKCWRPAAAGRKQCRYHLAYFRAYRQKRRKQGLCIDCGAPSPEYQLCDNCAQRAATQMKSRYYERRSRGRCTACGSPSRGYSLCDACTDRKAKRRKAQATA